MKSVAVLSVLFLLAAPCQAQVFKEFTKGLLTGQASQQAGAQTAQQGGLMGSLGGLVPGLGGQQQAPAQQQQGGLLGGLGGLIPGMGGAAQQTPNTAYNQTAPQSQQLQLGSPDLNSAQKILTGATSLPPGDYSITNMGTGQAFFLQVAPGGQTFAIDPRTVQSYLAPGGQAMPQQDPSLQAVDPNAPAPSLTQQAAGKLGGALKNSVTNYLQNRFTPGAVGTAQ